MDEMQKTTRAHAHVRGVERYGTDFNFQVICREVQEGRGKLVSISPCGRLIYDVVYQPGMTVRAVLNPNKTHVVTILPPKFKSQMAKEHMQARVRAESKRRRDFFKRLRIQDDEE